MHKNGRIGDLIASISVLIAVIFIMALFVAFSTGIFVTSSKDNLRTSTQSEIKVTEYRLFFEIVNINGENLTVLKALNNSWEHKIESEKFINSVKELVPSNGCLILAWKWSGNGAGDNVFGYLISDNSKIGTETINGDFRLNRVLDVYRNRDLLTEMPVSFLDNLNDEYALREYDDELTYYAYSGECLHE